MAEKKMIFVSGMHRSGTSAATRLLNILGAALPDTLLPPDPHINEKGYFEDPAVLSLNQSVLSHLHAAWYDIKPLPQNWWRTAEIASFKEKIRTILKEAYAPFDLAMIKDPRISLLFPLWIDAVQDTFQPLAVIVLRHPSEVAASLGKRDGLDKDYAALLWMRYVIAAFTHTRDLKRAVVTFDQIVSEPVQVRERVGEALGVSWPIPPAEQKRKISQDISRSLKHHAWNGAAQGPENQLLAMAADIYQRLCSPDPGLEKIDFSEISEKLDAPDGNLGQALTESLQNTNQRMIENTVKMIEIGEMHHHALSVISEKDQTIRALVQFKEQVVSHWAWPIMRRLLGGGFPIDD